MNKRDFLRLFAMSSVATLLPPIAKANSFVSPKKVLKIAHITDTHIMPFIGAAKGFERCLHHIQQNHPEVDLLLNTGDSIMEAHSKPKFFAQKQWSLFHSVLNSEVKIPILNSIGNHDISCEGDSKCNFQYGKQWA
ncbi:MAG: metallophosphoesterase family protein, partial [Saprospiraceae bacterium]